MTYLDPDRLSVRDRSLSGGSREATRSSRHRLRPASISPAERSTSGRSRISIEGRGHGQCRRRPDRAGRAWRRGRTGKVEIRSLDRRRTIVHGAAARGRRAFRGPLSWLVRLTHAFAPETPLTLTCRAEAPAGAGLGGSSALGIAVGAAFAHATGERLSKDALLDAGDEPGDARDRSADRKPGLPRGPVGRTGGLPSRPRTASSREPLPHAERAREPARPRLHRRASSIRLQQLGHVPPVRRAGRGRRGGAWRRSRGSRASMRDALRAGDLDARADCSARKAACATVSRRRWRRRRFACGRSRPRGAREPWARRSAARGAGDAWWRSQPRQGRARRVAEAIARTGARLLTARVARAAGSSVSER